MKPSRTAPPDPAPEGGDLVDFQELFHLVMSRLWLIGMTVLLFTVAAGVYCLVATDIYRATATVQIEQIEQRVLQIESVAQENLQALEILKTIEQNLQRRILLKRVARALRLAEEPGFQSLLPETPEQAEERIAFRLLDNLDVRLIRGTRLITISYDDPDAAMSARIANAVVEGFLQESIEFRSGSSAGAQEFLVAETDRLKERLAASELRLQELGGAIDVKNRIREQEKLIEELGQRYLEKHPRMIQARSLLNELRQSFLNEMSKAPFLAGDPEFQRLADDAALSDADRFRRQLQLAESRFNILTRDLETDRALYESVQQRFKETGVTAGLETVSLRTVEPALQPPAPHWPRAILLVPVAALAGLVVSLGLVVGLNLLDSSFKTVDAVESFLGLPVLGAVPELSGGGSQGPDPATSAGFRARAARVFRLLALRLRLARPRGRETAEGLTSAVSDLRQSFVQNLRVSLNLDPRPEHQVSADLARSDDYPLVLVSHPDSPVSEAFRSLRVSMSLLGKKTETQTHLFTSAAPSEGKSFTAANFAISLAQQGYKTLLIDTDLRRPTIHHYFQEKSPKGGVSDVLVGNVSFDQAVHTTPVRGLDVLLAGSRCPNPAELLSGDGIQELLRTAAARYQRVVIDSAPILAVSDTLLFASEVRTVCLVIRAFRTPRRAVRRALTLLQESGARVVGTVLNRLPVRTGFGYNPYYYHYGSSEGYGTVYGSDDSSRSPR